MSTILTTNLLECTAGHIYRVDPIITLYEHDLILAYWDTRDLSFPFHTEGSPEEALLALADTVCEIYHMYQVIGPSYSLDTRHYHDFYARFIPHYPSL